MYYVGDCRKVKVTVRELQSRPFTIQQVTDAIAVIEGPFAIIVNSPSGYFAVTDHCRTHPIFFSGDTVSNDARLLQANKNLLRPDAQGVRDARMAGFVTGGRTLFHGLNQLESGSFAVWNPNVCAPIIQSYTTYQPTYFNTASNVSLTQDFLSIIDSVIKGIIGRANGRPIWVPLSGGLDSRLILGKLVEHQYSNLFAFTYGPKGNDEAKFARQIAHKLGVKWGFFPSVPRDMRQFFSSEERSSYWKFSDGLCSLPNFQDFPILRKLQKLELLPPDSIIINGQTGDFISGGHIPEALLANSVEPKVLLSLIIKKHFSLWHSLKTPQNIEILSSELRERLQITSTSKLDRDEAINHYERFEYEERQSKFVINGQRNYEYLQQEWELPLWDRTVVNFWKNIPADLKYNQALYWRALKRWNFKNIFDFGRPEINHWPGLYKSILIPSRLIRLSFGSSKRDAFLKRMLYFGMYRDQYAPYSYRTFLSKAGDLRNPISLLSNTWLSELGLLPSPN